MPKQQQQQLDALDSLIAVHTQARADAELLESIWLELDSSSKALSPETLRRINARFEFDDSE